MSSFMLPLLIACASLGAAPGLYAEPGQNDNHHRRMAVTSTGPLKLSDDDFWGHPERTRREAARPFVKARQEALLLDAPLQVQLNARETLPLQVLRVATPSSFQRQAFDRYAVLVTTDLVNNITLAATAVAPSIDETSAPEPIDASLPLPEGIGTEAYTIDLRERLNLPWEPGRLLVRLIMLDQITAPRPVELQRSVAFEDRAVQEFQALARLRTQVPALTPPPDAALHALQREAKVPALPDGLGLNLAAPRVCSMNTSAPCVLRASFRLPVLKRHILPPGLKGSTGAGTEAIRAQFAQASAQGLPLPLAVVPITLVATGSESAEPLVWRLVVPVHNAIDYSHEQPQAIGSFSLDLRGLQGFEAQEQTLFVYAFSDAAMFGPLPIGLSRAPRTP